MVIYILEWCIFSITELNISNQELTQLLDDIAKYTNLQKLICNNNQITTLDNLPPKLENLICNGNKITTLDNLPLTLERLSCFNNPFTYDFKPTLETIRNYNTTKKLSS